MGSSSPQIRAAKPWLAGLERRVQSTLVDKPIVLTWGMKDPAFGRESVLERWQATFPQARLSRQDSAGHYIQEDAPEAISEAIVDAFGQQSG